MASVVIMPRQGNTVESCLLVEWRVEEGSQVGPDDVLCDIETDKAAFEVRSDVSGVLLKLLVAEGDDVPVLSPIAVIGAIDEDWESALKGLPNAPPSVAPAAGSGEVGESIAFVAAKRFDKVDEGEAFVVTAGFNKVEEDEAVVTAKRSAFGASPRARVRAAAEGVDVNRLAGTGPGGRVIERDVEAAVVGRPPLTAAAAAAVRSGAALSPTSGGTAIGGRVGLADLSSGGAGRPSIGEAALEYPGNVTETPLKGVRKLISERMRASLASSAQLTFNGSAPAERILGLRSRFKASDSALGLSDVTLGDLVLYAVSRVLPRFPSANATLEKGVLRTYERVHLALAVDTPRGLMVPVIRNADLLSLRRISSEAKRLAAACQAGSVNPDELSGGTFTVSNLGAFGVESFTPVLNAPQVAILGVNAVVPRAVPGPNGQIALEQRMGLSLTVDHQIIDGAPAARILKAVADAISDIDLLLMEKT